MKMELKEAKVDRQLMADIKKEMKEHLYKYHKTLSKGKKMLKRNLPLRRVVKITRKRNLSLHSERKILKGHVKELEDQMDMIQDELQKRGLKMKVVEEPKGQAIVNEDEAPKD